MIAVTTTRRGWPWILGSLLVLAAVAVRRVPGPAGTVLLGLVAGAGFGVVAVCARLLPGPGPELLTAPVAYVLVLAGTTGLGGGFLRDVLIGATPPAALADWRYLLVPVGAGLLTFFFHPAVGRMERLVNVFDAFGLAVETKEHLLRIAGVGTELATRRLMYVDIVRNGVPFLPHVPRWHAIDELNRKLTRLEVFVLDVVDVVVSKLKPFRPNDRSDIDAMIALDLVPHDLLVERFRSAADDWAGGATADRLPLYVKNLNEVERDMLGEDETEIELPSWI